MTATPNTAELLKNADALTSWMDSMVANRRHDPLGVERNAFDALEAAFRIAASVVALARETADAINVLASVTGTGTAETSQKAQGEACQNGPQGDAQNTPQVSDNEL